MAIKLHEIIPTVIITSIVSILTSKAVEAAIEQNKAKSSTGYGLPGGG